MPEARGVHPQGSPATSNPPHCQPPHAVFVIDKSRLDIRLEVVVALFLSLCSEWEGPGRGRREAAPA